MVGFFFFFFCKYKKCEKYVHDVSYFIWVICRGQNQKVQRLVDYDVSRVWLRIEFVSSLIIIYVNI